MAAIRETRGQAVAEYQEIAVGRTRQGRAKGQRAGAGPDQGRAKTRLQRLTAPVDGVVQQLAIHTVGGVVTPAQALLVIVPSDSRLEIEAMVSNRDIGFVHPGQEAEIKIDTFNFTRYGLLHGEVLSVSQDAIIRDQPQDRSGDRRQGAQNDCSEPKGQELNYSARISLDRTKMQIDDRMVDLSPGMAVTVEIKTGIAHDPELSALAAAALSAGSPARAVSTVVPAEVLFGLIAQDTLTVTDSVSSPCATGAAAQAAMPPSVLPAKYRRGATAFLGNAERLAERDAGGLGVDLRLAARVGDRLLAGVVEQL